MGLKLASPKAELNVLRGLLHKDPKISGTLIGAVDETYFYSPESIEIYEAVMRNMSVNGRNPTYRILIEDPELSDEARDHLKDSSANVQSIADANKAATILNKYRQRRGLYNIAADIGQQFKKSKVDIDSLMHRMTTAINIVQAKKATDDDFLHFGLNNNSKKMVDEILDGDRSEDIIPTGIEEFDKEAGGFARGSLVTIGANSGGGKSICASALAVNMAEAGYKVLLVPLEMSKNEMTARILANITNTDFSPLWLQKLSEEQKEKVRSRHRKWVKRAKKRGGRYTIFKPKQDLTIEEIMASINAFDVDVVIIDYISLLKGVDGDDQVKALGRAARYGKISAENSNRVHILVCQVDDNGKIKYARAISEHSSNSWLWISTPEIKNDGWVVKVEQPKSRNSLSFPFLMRIDGSKMRVYGVGMQETESLAKVKKGKELPNLATADV